MKNRLKVFNTEGDMTIKSPQEDTHIKGSQVTGENVTLEAKKNIAISAAENSNTTKENTRSSGACIGASLGVGGLQGVSASYGKASDHVKENETAYEKSRVTANKDLIFSSVKNTTITGSEMAGGKVTGYVGGNLSIKTKQDEKTYEEKNSSTGLSVNYSMKNGKTSVSGGISKDNIHSNYESATDQAGIRAGGEGFDISVKDNADLKGGVIDSAASKDKNTLTTGTLRWEDKGNKADYKAGGIGVSYSPNNKSSKLNQRGLTPNLTPTVKDKTDSTTKSAVAEGTIHITNKEKQKQDIASLNRDTKNSLNQLQEIFDKTKVEERQELVGMLEKYGNQAIHKYAESKGWKDGSTEKILLHGAFGALMGDMAGGSAASGALSGGVNEYVMGYLTKGKGEDWVQKHPDTVQWIAAGVGAAIGNLSKDATTDAYISFAASKWNYLGEGHENTHPKMVGIGVETKGLGHVALTISFEDDTWAEGDYGRYGGNETPSSGLRQTPIGRGTYITDNNYDPTKSDRTIFMLDPVIVSAPRVTNAYNDQFLKGGYARSYGKIGITESRTGKYIYYRKDVGAVDYNLLSNNCVTTTIKSIDSAIADIPWRAAFTLSLLRDAVSPLQVNLILEADYKLFGGKGLVTDIKKGEKAK